MASTLRGRTFTGDSLATDPLALSGLALLVVVGLIAATRFRRIWNGTDPTTSPESPFPIWYSRQVPSVIITMWIGTALGVLTVVKDLVGETASQPVLRPIQILLGVAFFATGAVMFSVHLFGRPAFAIPPRLRANRRGAVPERAVTRRRTRFRSRDVIIGAAILAGGEVAAWLLGYGLVALPGILLGAALLLGMWAEQKADAGVRDKKHP